MGSMERMYTHTTSEDSIMDKIKLDRAWEYMKELKPFLLYMWMILSLAAIGFATTFNQSFAAGLSLVLSVVFTLLEECYESS